MMFQKRKKRMMCEHIDTGTYPCPVCVEEEKHGA